MTLKLIERTSPNWNARRGTNTPDMVIIHYTGMTSARAALERLCDPTAKVSSHYLIDREGSVIRLVSEDARAWHAGVSSWHGETDINSRSIGIELVNPGHAHGYQDFPEPQMRALLRLLERVHKRNTVPPGQLLAHSDIAPARKQDPGEQFDWRRLAREGFGLWIEPQEADAEVELGIGATGPEVRALRNDLAVLGYSLAAADAYDSDTAQAVTAFQRHWRQGKVDGRADASTLATLRRLLVAAGAVAP
jgi:N-acetylmuramoyl-L-alanine amidase